MQRFCLKATWELEGKAKQVAEGQSCSKENLAAETSPFSLVLSLHNAYSFPMCISLAVILFCYLHSDENTGLHLGIYFLSDIYN